MSPQSCQLDPTVLGFIQGALRNQEVSPHSIQSLEAGRMAENRVQRTLSTLQNRCPWERWDIRRSSGIEFIAADGGSTGPPCARAKAPDIPRDRRFDNLQFQ